MGLPAEGLTAPRAPAQAKDRSEESRPVIVVLDPRSLRREGLANILQATNRFRVVAVGDPAELASGNAVLRPEGGGILINLGADSLLEDGVRAVVSGVASAFPDMPIIVVSDHEDSHHIAEALRQRIRGYIPSTLTSRILIEALRLILAGGTFVPAHALEQAVAERQRSAVSDAEASMQQLCLDRLTPRQREVLELLRQGKPNKIIAHELVMRESTVKVHVRQIMRKLQASNRTQAAFLASRCLD